MPFVAQEDRAERDRVIETFQSTPYLGPRALIINSEMIRIRRSYQCQGTEDIPRGGVLCPLHLLPESMAKPGSKKGCQGAHRAQIRLPPSVPGAIQHRDGTPSSWTSATTLSLANTITSRAISPKSVSAR